MEYRDNDALVIDVISEGRCGPPIVFGNFFGQDHAEFADVLDATVQDFLELVRGAEGDVAPQNYVIRAYTVRIPKWVQRGHERDFIVDVYGSTDDRHRSARNPNTPMYRYVFTVCGGK